MTPGRRDQPAPRRAPADGAPPVGRRDRLAGRAAVACGLLGAALMLGPESPAALAAGVLLLVAFVVLGVLRIASPDYLARGPEDDARR